MIARILVPLDGSKLSEAVLPFAEELARQLRAEVHFVRAVNADTIFGLGAEPGAAYPYLATAQLEQETEEAADYLTRIVADWQAKGIDAEWEILDGVPASAIINYAHSHRIDLIAMATHGRSGITKWVFGSVAEQVVRESATPVLVTRANGEAELQEGLAA